MGIRRTDLNLFSFYQAHCHERYRRSKLKELKEARLDIWQENYDSSNWNVLTDGKLEIDRETVTGKKGMLFQFRSDYL